MITKTITSDDATELDKQSWFVPMSQRPIPLGVREINLGDAWDLSELFDQGGEPVQGFHGFNPIATEGTAVTHEKELDLDEANGLSGPGFNREAFERLVAHREELFGVQPLPGDSVELLREAREMRDAEIEGTL